MSHAKPVLALGALILATAASAQQGEPVRVEVMVSHISERSGSVDERALELHRALQSRMIRYHSLRVLQAKQLALLIDQVGSLELPNGRHFRLRPMNFGKSGVLMAVELEGGMNTDVNLQRQIFIIGGPRYQDGTLMISVKRLY